MPIKFLECSLFFVFFFFHWFCVVFLNGLASTLDGDEVNSLTRYLAPLVSSTAGVQPAVRIPMTASSWLNISTKAASANFEKYPDLGGES